MDSHYQAIYRQAASMQHKFHDYTSVGGGAYNPTAAVLRQQIHGLTNDLATNKSPRMIEGRLRSIQQHLRTAELMKPMATQGHGPVLNNSQKNFLHSNFEHMRQNVMQHPHF